MHAALSRSLHETTGKPACELMQAVFSWHLLMQALECGQALQMGGPPGSQAGPLPCLAGACSPTSRGSRHIHAIPCRQDGRQAGLRQDAGSAG